MNGLPRFFQMIFSILDTTIHSLRAPMSRMKLARVFIRITMTLAVMGLTAMGSVLAQWSTNPTVNNPVSATFGDQRYPQSIPDGSGGVFIVWEDYRGGPNPDIYAQRLNATGAPLWTVDGVVISNAANGQSSPKIVTDNNGGAIITWTDNRNGGANYDIYAQRINASGVTLWTANGVQITGASGNQTDARITVDGSGGAIIAWNDNRGGATDIYAQKVDASGVAQWTVDGVSICAATDNQTIGGIADDGTGGAIITWHDFRNGTDNRIYAQRISSAGIVQWTADGIAVSTFASYQDYPSITADGSGGAFIAWRDLRNGDFDLYAQRVSNAGALQWGVNGVAVAVADGFQQIPSLVADGSGGVFIGWYDTRSTGAGIYAQRLNSSGVALWPANGVAASTNGSPDEAVITSDGAGGIFVSWYATPAIDADIFAQRIDGSGNVLWAPNGNVVCSANGYQFWHTMVYDGFGNAIVIWSDQRSGNWDIYAQRVTSQGDLGVNNPYFTVSSTAPGQNARNISSNSDITVNFSQIVNVATLTAANIKVYGSQTGLHSASFTPSGLTVTINPDVDFKPGEAVSVILTSGIRATDTDTLKTFATQFTVASNVAAASYPQSAANFGAGNGPHSVYAADFDGDGDLDMAIANYNSNTVSIRLNDGTGNFSGATDVGVGFNPTWVTAADFDGDNDLDIAVSNEGSGTVSIRMNDGAGNFSGSTNVAVGTTPRSVIAADFDSDGDLDIAAANESSGNVSIRLNDGAGNFSGISNVAVGSAPQSVAAADFDGDGDLDLAAANQSSDNISILRNDGLGNFVGIGSVAVAFGPASVVAVDFDGDGDADLASAGLSSSEVSIRLNDGAGNFSGTTDVTVGSSPFGVTTADFDGDGDMDIAAAKYFSNDVAVRFNDGFGNFSGSINRAAGTNARALIAADLDGDGKLEIATANFGSSNFSILKNASGYFNVTSVTPQQNQGNVGISSNIFVNFPQDINVATLNNATIKIRGSHSGLHTANYFYEASLSIDPDTDFKFGEVVTVTLTDGIIGTNTDTLNPYSWQFTVGAFAATGTFSPLPGATVGSTPFGVSLADLDGDGDLDMAAANDVDGTVSIRFNDGTGNFSGSTDLSSGTNSRAVTASDIDNDGDLDLLIASSGFVAAYINNGLGSFSGPNSFAIGGNGQSIFAADFDGDGDVDFVTANSGSNNVSIRLNDGAGNFSGTTDVAVGNLAVGVTGGDVDNDGDVDLLASNYNDNTVSILLNDGAAGFSSGGTSSVSFGPVMVRLADLDADTDLDLVTANEGGSDVSVRLNDGTGVFSSGSDISGLVSPRSVFLGDLDGDGDVDIAAGNTGGATTVSIRINDGSANFSGSYNAFVGPGPAWSIDGGDVDNDGDIDIIRVDGSVSGNTTVLKNNNYIVPTSVTPIPNTVGINPTANIVVEYPEDMSSFDAKVFGSLSGYMNTSLFYDNVLYTLTIDPTANFKPGEVVTVIMSGASNIAVSGNILRNVQFQFTAASSFAAASYSLPASNLAAGINPGGVATADFNLDGTIDIVATNISPSEVTIILNDGIGGILSSYTVPVGTNPYGPHVADLDNDGDVDIVTADAGGNTVTTLLNDGAGNFSGPSVAVGSGPYAVQSADIDGDGDLDLVVANANSNNVSVLINDGAANFTGGATVSVQTTPYDITTGDFDSDGDMDFATANVGANSISVRLNDGAGNFALSSDPAVGANPQGIQAADLDGDGDIDLVTANTTSNDVSVLLNDGSGNFFGGQTPTVGSNPYSIVAGDLDGDGDVDFATADWSANTVSVRVNDGTANFTGSTTISVGSQPYDIAAADLDGDGSIDLITPNAGSNDVSIAFNDAILPAPSGLYAVAQNGQVELNWTASPGATLYRIYHDVNPNPIVQTDSSVGTNKTVTGLVNGTLYYFRIKAINATDESGYSNEDAAVPVAGAGQALSLEGIDDEAAIFTSYQNLGVDPSSVTISAWVKPNGTSPSISAIYEGQGIILDAGGYLGLTRGDYTGQDRIWAYLWDGSQIFVGIPYTNGVWTHVAVVLRNGQLYAYKNGVVVDSAVSGNVQNITSGSIGVGVNPYNSVHFEGQIDEMRIWNRGLTDAEMASLQAAPSRGDEAGLLANWHFDEGSGATAFDASPNNRNLTLFNGPTYVVSGSMAAPLSIVSTTPSANGLSIPANSNIIVNFTSDILTDSLNTRNVLIRGAQSGDHTFTYGYGAQTANIDPNTDFIPGELVTVTLTRGIIAINSDTLKPYSWQFFVQTNLATGFFSAGDTVVVGTFPKAIAAADFNNDGSLDMAVVNQSTNDVSIAINDGSGGFTVLSNVAVGSLPYEIAAADFDGDGDIDIAVSNNSSSDISIRSNDGSGNFGVLANISTGVAQLTVAAGDFDGDGDVDLISSESGTQLRVRLNDGTGSAFSPGNVINVQNNPYFITVADFDNDGDLDLAASNYSSGTFSIRLNDGTGVFGGGGDFTTNGVQPRTIRAADFNGDGLVDIAFCNENSGNVGIRLNDGVGGFAGNEIGVGSLPQSITLGDFEGDGDIDVAAVNYGSTNVQTIINDGAGNFSAGSSYATGNGGVTISSGNFSGMATMEIVAADNTANVVYVLENAPVFQTTTVVTSKGDGGAGSLREAINYTNSHSGPDTIIFNVSVDSVLLASQLPDITDDSLFINGDFNSDNIPDVVIDGVNNGINESFVRIAANDVIVKGLTIIRFVQGSEAALTISNTAHRAKILYNYIGTDGTSLYSNVNNIDISAPAGGGQHEIRGNVISARGYGIYFYGSSNDLDTTKIVDNKIGTNAAGSAALTYPSHLAGINVQNGYGLKIHNNLISGWSTESAKAISFGYSGFSYYAKYVELFGNKIGTDATGTSAIPNSTGLWFDVGSNGNLIGDGTPTGRNIISGNGNSGIELHSDSNTVLNNFIGVDATGNSDLGNGFAGVHLQNSSYNTIGDNVISGNNAHGVWIFSNGGYSNDNKIMNNKIGVGVNGITSVNNGQHGVRIYAVFGWGARRDSLINNVIAHNNFNAVEMDGSSDADSLIMHGNSIFNNALGGMNFVSGSNGSIAAPKINSITLDSVVHGHSSPNAYIQIYADSTNQGRLLLATGYANGAGDFDLPVTLFGVEPPFLTALQDSAGRTSGFSVPVGLTLTDPSIVNSLADDGSPGTLRYGINYANSHPGPDSLRFDISLLGQTINLNSNLPDITDDFTFIDGDVDGDGRGDIQLYGFNPTADKGLNILSSYNEIRNLRISNFFNNASGIDIDGGNYNVVTGCYVDDNEVGIHIKNGGRGNRIGDGTIQGRNYIFNNTYNASPGMIIEHFGTDSNIVAGNFIGTEDGVTGSGNGTDGVIIRLGAKYNKIGDANAQVYNVISANNNHGILIESDSNIVVRNLIGTDSTGTMAMGNQGYGIHILNAVGNMIGDGTPAGRNVISNNSSSVLSGAGVMVENSSGTSILGNFVGADITGMAAMPNWAGGGAGSGVTLNNSSYNIIGDGTDGGRNVFGDNGSGADFPVQVYIQNSSNYNLVAGNYVGTDSAGTSSLGTGNGIGVYGSVNNQIGLNAGAAANVIAGNSGDGIILNNADSTKVFQNYIGVDRTGVTALPNNTGIVIENGTQYALIGNNTGSGGNILSGNFNDGIRIQDVGTDSNLIIGNLIGTDLSGSTALPNGNDGIQIDGGSANQIGEIGFGNLISGNSGNGVAIIGNTGIAAYNIVMHNLIGVSADSVTALGNSGHGVFIAGISTFAHNNEIIRNRIAYNTNFGITADQTGFQVDSDRFFANEIYSNGGGGISLVAGAHQNVWAPVITSVGLDSTVSGYAGQNALIQLYADSANQGRIFLDSVYANGSGNWAMKVPPMPGMNYTAIQDSFFHSSAFSAPVSAAYIDPLVVTSTLDDSSIGTLRYAIAFANTQFGRNLITFSLSPNDTIFVTRPMPNITDTLDIDGQASNVTVSAAPGYTGFTMFSLRAPFSQLRNFNMFGRGIAQRGIFIDNAGAGGNDSKLDNVDALEFTLIGIQGDAVRDTILNSHIAGNGTAGIAPGILWVLENNIVGTDAGGGTAYGIPQGIGIAIQVYGGIKIGQNLISGHSVAGIQIVESNNNSIFNNGIGTDVTATVAIPNDYGIVIDSLSMYNQIGLPGAGNVISGNTNFAINIQNNGADSNYVLANKIGTDITGTVALGNAIGVATQLTTGPNFVGDGTPAGRNIISANSAHGLYLFGPDVADNNFIGTDVTGTADLGNAAFGVYVYGANTRIINNVISGNDNAGVYIAGTNGHSVTGNFIGTDVTGNVALPNLAGITLTNIAFGSTIGGMTLPERNVISGNTNSGLRIENGARNITAIGNYIGLSADGLNDLGNGSNGVEIDNASGNQIGNGTLNGRNFISGNDNWGVDIQSLADSNVVMGNVIGTDTSGTNAVGYSIVGVNVSGPFNKVGGYQPGQGNIIGGGIGYTVSLGNSTDNLIAGNFMGVTPSGTPISGSSSGFYITGNSRRDSLVDNTIAYLLSSPLFIQDAPTDSIIFYGNKIHHNAGDISINAAAQLSVAAPRIIMVLPDSTVMGNAAPNALVQIFADSSNDGQIFVDTTYADGTGLWAKKVPLYAGMNLTAMQDSLGNTSNFSAPFTPSFAPAVPADLYAIARNGQIELKWNANNDGLTTKYRIYYDVTTNPVMLQDSTTGGAADTSKTITGLTNGQIYYFRVTALNAIAQESGFSNEDAAVPVLEAGNAVALNGVDQLVNAGNGTDLNLSVGTWEAWARIDNLSRYNRLIIKQDAADQGAYELFYELPTQSFRAEVVAGSIRYGVSSAPGSVQSGVWYHVAATYDGNDLNLYVNGVLEANATLGAGPIDNNTGPLGIGGNASGVFDNAVSLQGQVDEVRVWNVIRSQAEIAGSMIRPIRGDESGLVGLYHFDESGGSTVFEGTVNGYNGNVVNSGAFVFSGAMAPVAPTGLNTTPFLDSTLTVSWTANTEADLSHYYVYRSTTNGFIPSASDSIGRVAVPTNWFDDNTAQLGVTYYYRIAAIDSAGQIGSYSNQVAGAYPVGSLSATVQPVNFGNVALGSNAILQTKVYAVGGWVEVTNSSFDLGSQFSLVTPLTLPDTLSKNDTLFVDVRFTPNAFGTQTDTLRLNNNSGVDPFSIGLDGTGVPGTITSNVNPANYASVTLGNNATQTIKVYSSGGAVEVSGASIQAGTDFAITNGLTLPDTLFANDTLFVDVQFTPTAFSALTDTLVVTNNSGTPVFKIALNGTGIAGTLVALPSNYDFGNVAVEDSATALIRFVSSGGAVSVSGSAVNSNGYSIVSQSGNTTLFAGDTLTYTIQFKPQGFVQQLDTLKITNNSIVPIVEVPLSGTGISGTLFTDVSSLDFGNVTLGSNAERTVKIYSQGGLVPVFTAINGPVYSLVSSNGPNNLYTGDTLTIVWRYTPTAFGVEVDTMYVTNTATGSILKVPFTGTGVSGAVASNVNPAVYGNVSVGSNSTQTIKIYSNGGAVRVSGAAIQTGTDFAITNALTLPDTLFANDTLFVDVQFTPTAFSSLTDTLVINNNSGTPMFNIALDGTGVSGAIASNVNPAIYGNVSVGSNSTQTIKVYSTGGAVRVSGATIQTGTDFAITNVLTLPDTLFANDTLFVDVQFAPTAFSSLTDTLVVTNNSGTPMFKVALDGTGISGSLASNVNPANYGNVAVGGNSTQTLKVYSNGGAVEVTAASIQVGADYSIVNALTLPDTLFAGDTLQVDVQFTPSSFAAVNDSLMITNNSGIPVFKIALDGTGVPGTIASNVNPANYGGVALGGSSTQTIKVYSNGGAVRVSGATIQTGTDFAITNALTLPDTLFANDTLLIDVQFTPTAFSALTDTLVVMNNTGTPVFKIALDGTGISGSIASNVNPAGYGNVSVGSNSTQTIKVYSNGGAVRVSGATIQNGTDFAITNGLSLPDTLFANDTLFVDVQFAPTAFSSLTDTLVITNNSGTPVFKVALNGTGVSGTIASSTTSVSFGNVPVGDSVQAIVKVYSNSGAVSISGTTLFDASTFRIDSTSGPSTLFGGDTLLVYLKYLATNFVLQTDTLLITNNSGVSPLKIRMGGTGIPGTLASLPASFDFGNVPVGDSAATLLKVYSVGGAVTTSAVFLSNDLTFRIDSSSGPATLYSGDTLYVWTKYLSGNFASFVDSVVISNNSVSGPFKVALNGSGIPGSLTAVPSSVDFGNVAVSDSAQLTFKLYTTNGAVSVSTANMFIGSSFRVDSLSGPLFLFAGDTLTVYTTYRALNFGAAGDSIFVLSNAANGTVRVPVLGNGVPGMLSALPASFNFGNVQAGDSLTYTFKLYSTGGAVSTSGANLFNGTQYMIISSTGPSTLYSGDTLALTLRFKPLTFGLKNDTLRINNNSAVSPFKIAVAGTGSIGTLFASQTSLNFGSIQIGDSTSQSIKIYGSSNGIDVTAAMLLSGTHFSVSTSQALPVTLNIGDTLTATIRFKPQTFGAIVDTAQIINISVNNPLSISLSGAGAIGTLAPLSANFGLVTIGDSATQVLKLYTGSGAVIVDSLKFDFGTEFSFTALGALPDTVFPGDTLFMGVKYKPLVFATTSDTIRVYNNSLQNVFSVKVNGIGNSGTLVVVPASANFGNVLVGDSSVQRLKLYANGANVIVSAGSLETGTDYSIVSTSGLPVTLVAGVDTLTVDVKFKPSTFGPLSDRLIVTNNSLLNPVKVNLTGSGAAGTLSASPFGYSFGNVAVNSSAQQPVKIFAASGKVIVTNLAFDNGITFTLNAGSLPDTLSSGDTLVATITFSPAVTGILRDSLRISNNSQTSSVGLGFDGTGEAGALVSDVAVYNFGNIKVGNNVQRTFKVFTSTGQVIVSGLTLGSSGSYSLTSSAVFPVTLNTGDTLLASVRYTPAAGGTDLDTLYVTNNSAVSVYRLELSGFGVVNSVPYAFALKQPGIDSTVNTKTPVFTWEGRGDVDGDVLSYTLQISKNSNFSSIIQFGGITDTVFTLSSPLDSLGSYYWRVSANDNQGGITVSNTGLFSVDAVNPGLFVGILASTIQQNYIEVYVHSDETLNSLTGIFVLRDASSTVVDTDTLAVTNLSGLLYHVPYKLSVDGELTMTISGTDAVGNVSTTVQVYDISAITAKTAIALQTGGGLVTVSGAKGSVDRSGYLLVLNRSTQGELSESLTKAIERQNELPKALLAETISPWTPVGEAVRILSTVEIRKSLTVTMKYDRETIRTLIERYPGFIESKIGMYREEDSRWIYEGGEGDRGQVSAKVSKLGVLGLFYNPEHVDLPKSIELSQNYPNPFNPSTSIRFGLPDEGKVKLVIYNVLGQKVRELINESRSAGYHTALWNGKNDLGQEVASGLYIYRLETVKGAESRKMLLVK